MPRSSVSESLQEATATYERLLPGSPAEEWLATRGLDLDAARTHLLGYVGEPHEGHVRFRGHLAIPYVTRAGVVAMKFRCVEHDKCEGHPKYTAPAGQRPRLYGVNALFEDSPVIAICEGELDAVVCQSLLGIPAVGIPGVNAWQRHFPRCFVNHERVLVMADNDSKADGRNPGRELADRILSTVDQAVLVDLPVGMDLNSWYLDVGAGPIRAKVGLE